MQTVLETRHFSRAAAKTLSDEELDEVIWLIAQRPEAGDLIPDSGGLRKIRVRRGGRGKRGGARVIYYFFDRDHPIYLLDVFAKNERVDLSAAERRHLRAVADELKASFRQKRKH
ncbi:MAG TPA: type II toxin-antitoxin system RelE/ParE family toxin [Reyranella sp.]|nr:type II toxin-antitoxin system RelE/ParE family toxin [Reyranella sp.]